MRFSKTKQTKLTTLLNKGKEKFLPNDDVDVELQAEVDKLEQQLKEKQDELFLLQRDNFRQKAKSPKPCSEVFIRPQKIVLENSIVKLEDDLEVLAMLTGMEVTSYVAGDHCSIIYHIQHDQEHEVKHGFRIEMQTGETNEISKSSLPVGFNMEAVSTNYDSIMRPECLRAIRKALVAYYDRLAQFEALKKLVTIEAQLFKILDGSHVEIAFAVKADDEEEAEPVTVLLILDYDVTEYRPKSYQFKRGVDQDIIEVLTQQCLPFMKKPLDIAFREAFMEDFGRYRLVQQVGHRTESYRRPKNRARTQKHDYNNDDTFLPEDCSEMSYSE